MRKTTKNCAVAKNQKTKLSLIQKYAQEAFNKYEKALRKLSYD